MARKHESGWNCAGIALWLSDPRGYSYPRPGASARERLEAAAARAWGVGRSAVTAKQGVLSAGSRRAPYAQFAAEAGAITLDREPEIKKNPDEWWLLGQPTARLDVPVKVDGSA